MFGSTRVRHLKVRFGSSSKKGGSSASLNSEGEKSCCALPSPILAGGDSAACDFTDFISLIRARGKCDGGGGGWVLGGNHQLASFAFT